MFAQTYLKVFGNNILDNLIYLNSNFIKLFPNKTVMNKWAETHYKKDKSNHLLKYCDPNIAIPLIKEKINVTSDIRERKYLVILLLENCQKNEDFTSLETVLKYICFRHRNEENTSEILNQIRDLFKLEELDENHWNHINEMLTILKLRKQSYYYTVTFYLKYIEYLILHGKPYRKELVLYIKEFESSRYSCYVDLENKKIKRQILIEIVNIYREVEEIDDIEFKTKFIRILIEFNEHNTEYIIDLSDFSGFLPCIKSILDSDYTMLKDNERNLLIKVINYNFKFPEKPIIVIEETRLLEIFQQDSKESFNFGHIVEKSIKKLDRSEFDDSVVELFWDNLGKFKYFDFCRKIIHWLLLNNPKAITPYFDLIWTANQTYIKIKEIKFMSHLGFDKTVVSYCTDKLTWLDDFLKDTFGKQSSSSTKMETDSESQKEIDLDMYKKVIEYLSILLTTDEYIEIISKRFLPVKEKINLADEALNQMYYLQCEVAGSLKKLHEPIIVLPTLMKFCVGDYLQSALPSLYSICYRAPEELLYSYMDVLSKRAVSVKKHALFLSCEVLNYDYALSRLRNFDENHVSSQKHMFSATLKYFRKNPCEELLTLVALNLNTIDKNDDETLTSLVNIVVPKKYKTVYIKKCWHFFENLRKEDIKVQRYLKLFLDAILASEDIFLSLPFDFYKHVITHYFKNPPKDDHNLNGINRFVCSFLRNVRLEQADNFKFIFDIIPSFPTQAIKSFFDHFYDLATDDVKNNNKIDTANNYYIELFKQHWSNTFTPIKMFNEHVLLDLLYFKCKSSDNIVKNYANEVLIYLEELIAEYGPYIYYKFKDLVLHKHTFTKREIYLFLYNILTIKNSTINYILVIDLINSQSRDNDVDDIHSKIMEILKNSDQPIVSVYFNSYFG
ncbi:uncharacterized protein LOC108913618 [Anoplophora glabripennis]|uniref:uncharacterized protein LOC108913618 n=1 Tax=Anoplophora glabripennis TaxID=217634 RepID=UPI00087382A7|nr:uncharacterized protein LOC108913618 [Anoplophora glabripennis]